MSYLMRMGSHDKSCFNPVENFSNLSTIKKVNFTSPDDRGEQVRDFLDHKEARPSKSQRMSGERMSGDYRLRGLESLPNKEGTRPTQHPYANSVSSSSPVTEVHQAPDFAKMDLALDSEHPKRVSDWLRKVSQV